jgi:hypothetical protein
VLRGGAQGRETERSWESWAREGGVSAQREAKRSEVAHLQAGPGTREGQVVTREASVGVTVRRDTEHRVIQSGAGVGARRASKRKSSSEMLATRSGHFLAEWFRI